MRRTENEAAFRIARDAVRRAFDQAFGQLHEHVQQGAAVLDRSLQEIVVSKCGAHIAHADEQPERSVGRVAVSGVGPGDHVADGAVLHQRGELEQDLLDVIMEHRFRHQPSHENERIAAPVQEPRVSGDHGLQFAAFDDECPQAVQHHGPEVVGHPVVARLLLRHGRHLRFILARQDLTDQIQRVVSAQFAFEITGAVQVAVRVQTAFRFVFLVIHVRPFVGTPEGAGGRHHAEDPVGSGFEHESTRGFGHGSGERVLRPLGRFGQAVEIAVLQVGADEQLHRLFVGDRLAGSRDRITVERHPDGVAFLNDGKFEHKSDRTGVPDGDIEIPNRTAVGRDVETVDHFGGDRLASCTVDHPEAEPSPDDMAVDRDLRVQVRQQDRVVTAEETSAFHADMDRGAAPVGLEERPPFQEEIVAGEGNDGLVDVGRQEHQHGVVAAEPAFLGHENRHFHFRRLVRRGQRRHDGDKPPVRTGNRTCGSNYAFVAPGNKEPEPHGCGHQDRTARRDNDFAVEILRPFPDDVRDVRPPVEEPLQETSGRFAEVFRKRGNIVVGGKDRSAAFRGQRPEHERGGLLFFQVILFVLTSMFNVFSMLFTHRAVGHWVARTAPKWAGESGEDLDSDNAGGFGLENLTTNAPEQSSSPSN